MTFNTKDYGLWNQSGERFSVLNDSTYVTNPGIQSAPTTWYSVQPLSSAANNIALSQTPANAGALVLTAGAGMVGATIAGLNVLKVNDTLISPVTGVMPSRAVVVTGNANTAAVDVTINGFDMYGQKVTNTFTGPVGANTTTSTKTFSAVYSITVSAGTTGAISVGTASVIGFPYVVENSINMYAGFNNAYIDPNNIVPAVTTNPATAQSGDVRGKVTLAGIDGSKVFGAHMIVLEAIKAPSDQNLNKIIGVTQYSSF